MGLSVLHRRRTIVTGLALGATVACSTASPSGALRVPVCKAPGITMTPTTLALTVGDTATVVGHVVPTPDITCPYPVWQTDSAGIAAVRFLQLMQVGYDSAQLSGLVTAVAPGGPINVNVAWLGLTGTVAVTVKAKR